MSRKKSYKPTKRESQTLKKLRERKSGLQLKKKLLEQKQSFHSKIRKENLRIKELRAETSVLGKLKRGLKTTGKLLKEVDKKLG